MQSLAWPPYLSHTLTKDVKFFENWILWGMCHQVRQSNMVLLPLSSFPHGTCKELLLRILSEIKPWRNAQQISHKFPYNCTMSTIWNKHGKGDFLGSNSILDHGNHGEHIFHQVNKHTCKTGVSFH